MNDATTMGSETTEEVMGRLMADLAATAGLQMTLLGIRTGMWKAMAGAGPMTPGELAARAGLVEPYVREWLKHQAASGYVVHDPSTGSFELPDAVGGVLAEDGPTGLVEGFATMLATMPSDQPLVEEAFRTGAGVGWHQRSAPHWHGMDMATSSAVVPALLSDWIPAVEGLDALLREGAQVVDVGCGFGAVLIALAREYPESTFWGFDYHDGSVAQARKAAAEAGVADRVRFEVATADAFPGQDVDLVLLVDTLHDLGDPVGALRRVRDALRHGGTALVVEFAAGDRLEDDLTPFGRLLYASSALVCTPNALSQGATDPLGTAPGEQRLTGVAKAAGFRGVSRLAVPEGLNLVLQLRP